MQALFEDFRHILRQLARNPGFTFAAVLSLALGIGATTAVFSVIYAGLIHPYPYKDADRIFRLLVADKTGSKESLSLNSQEIQRLRQSPAVEDLFAWEDTSIPRTGVDYPEEVRAAPITTNGFEFLGEHIFLGRGIQPSDAIDGQEPQQVVVLSYKFWNEDFNSSPQAVGQTIELNRRKYTIIGVADPRFRWQASDVYMPMKLKDDPVQTYSFVLRLKPGISRSAALAMLQPFFQRFQEESPTRFPDHVQLSIEGLNDWVVRDMGVRLYLLFGGVGFLLVIGCANVSILLLAHGSVRRHEFAVRSALGASRARMIRLLLIESVAVSLVGAFIGVVFAYTAVAAMKVLLPEYGMLAAEFSLTINLPILCFSIAVALVSGILSGVTPAFEHSKPQAGRALQSGVRAIAGNKRDHRMHGILISGQIALALLLITTAGSSIEAFVRLLHAPLGYDPQNVISVFVPLQKNTYTDWKHRLVYFEQLRDRVSQMPGVTRVELAPNATPPFAGSKMHFEILGQSGSGKLEERVNLVGPQYFSTLRIPFLQGRVWNETEDHTAAHLAVVNQAFARRYFPNGNAIGHSIKIADLKGKPPDLVAAPGIEKSWLEVVGVVADNRNQGVRTPAAPAIFIPWSLSITPGTQLLVRAGSSPLRLLHSIRSALATVNPDQQAARVVVGLDTWISNEPEWQQERLMAWLLGAFAVVGLCLAAVGLYSVVSYAVAQKTGEIGIRIALGAPRLHILRLVFRSTTVSVGAGVLAGGALAIFANRMLSGWMNTSMNDPLLLPTAIVLLSMVALVACMLPARKASRVDPMTALRND